MLANRTVFKWTVQNLELLRKKDLSELVSRGEGEMQWKIRATLWESSEMARNPSVSVRRKNTWVQGSKRAVKVQSLLTYGETVLSERTEAVFSGKPKALGLAFHGYLYANFRAPAQAQTCLVFGHKTVLRALGELHLGEEEGSLSWLSPFI